MRKLLKFILLSLVFIPCITVYAEEEEEPWYLQWKQCSEEWGSEIIASSGNIMTKGACSETSQAVIIKLAGLENSDDFTPLTYLRWAEKSGQAFAQSMLYQSAVGNYTDDNMVLKESVRDSKYNDDDAIFSLVADAYQKGYFIIMHISHVKGGGHFVPVVGVDLNKKIILVNQVGRNDLPGVLNYTEYYGNNNQDEIMDGADFYECKTATLKQVNEGDAYMQNLLGLSSISNLELLESIVGGN